MRAKLDQYRRAILLGLAALALLACAVGVRPLGGKPARAQTAGDQSLLLQLAQRLLSVQVPGINGAAASVQLYPGALAPDFPSGIPLPPNSTLIGSDERPSSPAPPPIYNGLPVPQATPTAPSGVHVDVVLDAPGSANDLTSFYKQALTSAGWTPPTTGYGSSGFISSSAVPQPTTYCRPGDHAQFSVLARPTNSGPLDVRLSFDTGFNPQCNPPPTPSNVAMAVIPVGQGLMPALQPPQGVRVVTQISGPGPFRTTSDAVAITDMSAADLHNFYAGELSDAGWTQSGSGGDAALAWSTWSIPDHPDLQGFLYVRDGPASGQRSLHLEIGSTNPNASLSPSFAGSAVSATTVPLIPLPGSTGVDIGTPATPAASATPTPATTPAP